MARRFPVSVYNRLSCTSYRSRPLVGGYRRPRPASAADSARLTCNDGPSSRASDPGGTPSRVNLHPLLRLTLLRSKGISQLSSVQESSFLSILSGKDVTIHAPIGSGKTLSYLLPIVNNIYNIHDLLEDLQLGSGESRAGGNEDSIRVNSLGYTRRVPHALLPTSMSDLRQDPAELQAAASQALESKSTADKLLDTLCAVDPHQLRRRSRDLPSISRSLWGRRSRNSVLRALMSNPLGTVRCCVIVVPNKDLASQVLSEISALDPLGRLSVQTLTEVHRLPPRAVEDAAAAAAATMAASSDQPFFPSSHALHYLSQASGNVHLSLEDEREMVRSIPTPEVAEGTVELVPVNMGRSKRSLAKVPMGLPSAAHAARQRYSVDGLVVSSVEFVPRPVISHPVIQYGSCDIVVTTPQPFLNDILCSKKLRVVPACVVFDEVDALFEESPSRSAMMEICSHLRPRPRLYNPLVHARKPRRREVPPCQFVHVASTLHHGGMQTAGSMLYERFSTSSVVSSARNHLVSASEMEFISVDSAFEFRLRRLVEVLVGSPFPKTVVYIESLKALREVYDVLRAREWPVMSFHGRSTLATRLAMLEAFRTADAAIFVCTDLLARGIELAADHVINFSFPTNAARFVHRAKGMSARVTNFVTPGDEALASEIRRLYLSGRPVDHVFSRKRSLHKRRVGALRRLQEASKLPRRPIRGLASTWAVEAHAASPPGDVPTEGGSAPPANRGHPATVPTRAHPRSNDTEEARYRRLSLKRRGLEFYDNFSAFS